MKYLDFKYDEGTEHQITRQILYVNATFYSKGVEEVFSDYTQLSPCAISIITPSQIVNVPFEHGTTISVGHAALTDIVLSRIYPDYVRTNCLGSDRIYFENQELNNIFIIFTGGEDKTICIVLPEKETITSRQYEELSKYIQKLKESKGVKSGTICSIQFGDNLIDIDEVDNEMEKLKSNIKEMEFPPREYRIDSFNFSGCRTEDEFMQRAKKHAITLNRMMGIKSDYSKQKERAQKKESGKKPISNERLMTLRKKGYTYQEIVDILEKEGYEKISPSAVRCRIIAICEFKGIDVPKKKKKERRKKRMGKEEKDILDQTLMKLSSYEWSYRKMERYLKEMGISVSFETIRKRIIEIKAKKMVEKEKRTPRKAHAKLIEHLLKLKESKGATDEQIGIIAKTYGINLKDSRKPKQLVPNEELDLR